MGIPLLATDPQYMFPPGSTSAGLWIGLTLEPFPLGGYTMQVGKLVGASYQDTEWYSVGSPTLGDVYQQSDINAAGGYFPFLQSFTSQIQAFMLATFPIDVQPPSSWIAAYTPPAGTDLMVIWDATVALFSAVPSETKTLYEAFIVLRNAILNQMNDYQIELVQQVTYKLSPLMTRSAFMAYLGTADAKYLATLPPG